MMKLVLFDIDGTILDSGGAGTRSLNYALRELLSVDNAFEGISMAGKTDIQIIKECLVRHKFPVDNGVIPKVMNAYVRHLGIEIHNAEKHIKPGIREALSALTGKRSSFHLGLLTGNIEQGARIKLEPFSLNGYFPSGAFGDDNEDRNKLLPVARERFEALGGMKIDFKECIIVGDTPRDVHCAKPYGSFCIGVATGPYSVGDLMQAGADAVFENLSDTEAFLRALNS